MKTNLKKKLTKSQKQEFIYRDKSYDWEQNYVKLIRDYTEGDYSYDIDSRHNLVDGEKISDILFDDICKMFEKSGLGINNKNKINQAITVLCKENSFSKKKEIKQQKAKELPDKAFKTISDRFGANLAYAVNTGKAYFDDHIIDKEDISKIEIYLKSTDNAFKYMTKSNIKSIINDVAKLKKFETKINIEKNEDMTWNIIKDIDEDKWEDELVLDDKGNLKHTLLNYALFLSFHPQFRNTLKYNAFDKIELITMYDKDYDCLVNKPIDDDVVNIIKGFIEQYFGDFNTKYVEPALSIALNNKSYHEIKQKFKEIESNGWDGKPRMHEMFIHYFGCEDNPYIREMTEVMMCGSAQRILEERPDKGTMFDYMAIMFGKQGTGKTKFMTRLYFGDKYTTINPPVNDDQKFVDLSNRAFLCLFDEMKGIDKADMPTVKSRITEQGCNVRLSYGRRSKYYPRHIVFWGNTNYKGVLRDEGYERRFLCFECKNETKHTAEWWKENYTDYDIEQIWAETLMIYHDKYEGKVLQISQETEQYNYSIQIKHKVWVEDSRTDLELKEMLNYKHYHYPMYIPEQWRIWMKTLDELKTGNTSTHGNNELKIVNCKWILSRVQRKQEWITGMIEQLGWRKIHVKDDVFGDEDYYIKGDLTFEDIKNEYNSYASDGYESQKLPF